jgi:phage baseplate assembly protein W|tara:strand:- start:5032 stop:5421 length:390 start_codon:yes stop_codon:yes gene_type:complete
MSFVSKSFRDFSLTFEKNAVTNDVLSLKNEAAIKAAVKNIVLYNFYEKPFDPAFGGNIIGLLFENVTPDLISSLERQVADCINLYEPRVAVYEVTVDWEEDYYELNVSVAYVILGIPPKFDNIEVAFKP